MSPTGCPGYPTPLLWSTPNREALDKAFLTSNDDSNHPVNRWVTNLVLREGDGGHERDPFQISRHGVVAWSYGRFCGLHLTDQVLFIEAGAALGKFAGAAAGSLIS